MERVTNYVELKSNAKVDMSPEGDFFKFWVAFLTPIHSLTKREREVLSELLKERYKISKRVTDTDIVDRELLSDRIREQVTKKCHIKKKHLNVILTSFRKKGVLRKEKIYTNLIPTLDKNGTGLMINFNFKNEREHIKLGSQADSERIQSTPGISGKSV